MHSQVIIEKAPSINYHTNSEINYYQYLTDVADSCIDVEEEIPKQYFGYVSV